MICPTASGTWTPAGNPYIIGCDSVVPTGETLTIQPGVIVWVGSNVSLTVNGQIQAVGTPGQRITFGTNDISWRWNTINVRGQGGTNRFDYCDFQNANTALSRGGANRTVIEYCSFRYDGTGVSITYGWGGVDEIKYCNFQDGVNGITIGGIGYKAPQIMNCTFSNLSTCAIYGEAAGTPEGGLVYLEPTIRNSLFSGTGFGCHFKSGYGNANPQILGNVFRELINSALYVDGPGGGSPIFINNTVVNVATGVSAQDPWDIKVQDCIFVGNTDAVRRSGANSGAVGYNCFYGNATNFTGYPATYGQILLQNRNGTPCDIIYNIYQNPVFAAFNDFHLQTNSPCIDAGTPDWAYTDMCITNGASQGTSFPDLGAYGGPDACNWLDDVPVLPTTLFITKSDNLVWLNWGAVPRSEYQVECVTDPVTSGTNTWRNFGNGHVRANTKLVSLAVSPNPATNQAVFRVKSMGRTPGN